jgi:hypothetical protein
LSIFATRNSHSAEHKIPCCTLASRMLFSDLQTETGIRTWDTAILVCAQLHSKERQHQPTTARTPGFSRANLYLKANAQPRRSVLAPVASEGTNSAVADTLPTPLDSRPQPLFIARVMSTPEKSPYRYVAFCAWQGWHTAR